MSWTREYSYEVAASPHTIWDLFADTSRWREWNAGVAAIHLEGPFATGTWFSMTLPDGEMVRTQLIEVAAPTFFTDETWVDQTVVRVTHRIEPLSSAGSRVVFAVAVEGPDAATIGEGVSADFPAVVKGLAKLAEKQSK